MVVVLGVGVGGGMGEGLGVRVGGWGVRSGVGEGIVSGCIGWYYLARSKHALHRYSLPFGLCCTLFFLFVVGGLAGNPRKLGCVSLLPPPGGAASDTLFRSRCFFLPVEHPCDVLLPVW